MCPPPARIPAVLAIKVHLVGDRRPSRPLLIVSNQSRGRRDGDRFGGRWCISSRGATWPTARMGKSGGCGVTCSSNAPRATLGRADVGECRVRPAGDVLVLLAQGNDGECSTILPFQDTRLQLFRLATGTTWRQSSQVNVNPPVVMRPGR